MTVTETGGPGLPQERRIVTSIPGPKSQELLARKQAAVSDGIGTILPVFITAAGGGVLVDVDNNSFIDLGAGIAVVNVGNAAPAVVAGIQAQAAAVHTHLLHGDPLRGLRRCCRGTQSPHPRRPRQEDGALQLRRRGSRERRQDCSLRHQTSGSRGLRTWVPRPHEPHDGTHREVDAVQVRLRPVRRRDLPDADGLPVPLAGWSRELRDAKPSSRRSRR